MKSKMILLLDAIKRELFSVDGKQIMVNSNPVEIEEKTACFVENFKNKYQVEEQINDYEKTLNNFTQFKNASSFE